MAELSWVPVVSSNLSSVAYDQDTRTLYIRFQSGGEYTYADVPVEVAQSLIRAASPGRFFNERVKHAYRQE